MKSTFRNLVNYIYKFDIYVLQNTVQKYISIHISFCCATQVPMQHAIPNLSKLVFWYWVLYAIIWMFYSLDQNFGSRILVLVICYCKFTTLWKKFLNLYCIQINVGKYSSIVHTEVVLREYDCPSFVAGKKKLMQLLARIFKGAKLFKLLRDTISSKVGIGTLLSSVGNILKCIIFQTDQIEDCWCGTNWLLTSQFNVEFCAFTSEWKVPNNIFSRQPEYNFLQQSPSAT